MLFKFDQDLCIFIHVPKTGGNSIQASLVEAGMSLDKLVAEDHQDGFDRFKIRGSITRTKHQSMSEYFLKNPYLAKAKAYSCVRRPFERMVSYYFSPNRHVRKKYHFFGPYCEPETVKFNESEFLSLVEETPTASTMLCPCDTDRAEEQITLIRDMMKSNQLQILRTENLSDDFLRSFKFPITKYPRNVSFCQAQLRSVLESATLRKSVETGKHAVDLELFY